MLRHTKERGQVMVFFALLLPIILGIGSVVVSVGDWYVHRKNLQTLVDAGALGGAPGFSGCFQDPIVATTTIRNKALEYAGDRNRAAATRNKQFEEPSDVHVLLNSDKYWNAGNPSDNATLSGTGWDNTFGMPCDRKYLDVKGTDDRVPLLFKWLPAAPSPKARARIEIHKVLNLNGMLPFSVPEFEPVKVAALFVDEGYAADDAASVTGRGFLVKQTGLPPADPLSQWNTWRADVSGVGLGTSGNHNVVILASRDPNACITPGGPCGTGSLSAICAQNTVETHCYGGSSNTSGINFIHVYAGTGGGINPPAIRDATLSGGCGTDLPPQGSAPYFNVDGTDASGNGCALGLSAKLDFGTGGADPTGPPTCAAVSSPDGPMTYNAGSDTWIGSYTIPGTPAKPPAGRYTVDLDWATRKNGSGPCPNTTKINSGTLPDVTGAYVSDTSSATVQYLTLVNNVPPPFTANSWPKTVSASIKVTVGFTPILRDAPVTDPAIKLRYASVPGSQNQAVDCDSGGASGFLGAILVGCQTFYTDNKRNGVCSPDLTPPDCIEVLPGDKTGPIRQGIGERFANPCTPNNWPTALGQPLPDPTDPRLVILFITDETSFTSSGRKLYPIRRFGAFYITSADGMNCPGDVPSNPGSKNVWGHFYTYTVPNPNATPSAELCAFDQGNPCLSELVE